MNEVFLTEMEAAVYLEVDTSKIKKLVEMGRLHPVKMDDNSIRYKQSALCTLSPILLTLISDEEIKKDAERFTNNLTE